MSQTFGNRVDTELRHLTRMIHETPVMLTRCSRDMRYVFVSRGYAEMLGRQPREIEGQAIVEIMGQEGLARIRPHVDEVLAGRRVEYEGDVHFAGVGMRSLRVVYSPDVEADGSVIGWFASILDLSDQKRARDARALTASIVESSFDAIITKSLDGIVTSWNGAAEHMFGYSAADILGKPVRILIPPERQAEEDEILARLREGERVEPFETVRLTKDGRQLDISLTISPVRDSSGAIVAASKIARDITERKRAAAALAAQQEWFRVTLASIGDAVIATDAAGCVSYMNAAAETLTGWRLLEATGRRLEDVFHIVSETTREPVENPVAMVMRSGQVVGLANHTVLICRDGIERPIADSGSPIRDSEGRILGVVLVFRDVTAERQAEEALAEQREWLETTLVSIGDAVIATDVRGRVVFMNPIAEHLTGWRIDAARGRACADVFNIVNEQTRRLAENPVTRVLADGAVVGLANHTVLIAADGTERPIDDNGAPIRNREGRIVGVVLVFRDVTERRRAEIDRQFAAAERERLLEAERMARNEAERASLVKDEFVAMVSHELRTPLNAILGWAQLMMKSPRDPAVIDRGLDVVSRNTRLQAQLVSDLLDLSRILAGKLRLDIQSVDLASVVTDAVETVQAEADTKGINVRPDVTLEPIVIAGDPGRVQQIIWNLMSNALKFTPPGGQVHVSLRRVGSRAEIAVRDTGAGIRPDVLPHIFDRFHQADRSITRRFGGLGLGLSIVKSLVEHHGGTVHAESDGEGTGATFTVVLPTSTVQPAPYASPPAPTSAGEAGEVPSLQGLAVLVVEDEADTRDFVTRLLEAHGAKVTAVTSAAEAIDALAASPPDMLVSDIGLPNVDGYDLMKRIRANEHADNDRLPAIALTAYARAEDRTRALMAGYQAHVAKPVEPLELVATLARLSDLVVARGRKRFEG
jgi:PAS domain S-box-containing protein